jgi:hypothetical protein
MQTLRERREKRKIISAINEDIASYNQRMQILYERKTDLLLEKMAIENVQLQKEIMQKLSAIKALGIKSWEGKINKWMSKVKKGKAWYDLSAVFGTRLTSSKAVDKEKLGGAIGDAVKFLAFLEGGLPGLRDTLATFLLEGDDSEGTLESYAKQLEFDPDTKDLTVAELIDMEDKGQSKHFARQVEDIFEESGRVGAFFKNLVGTTYARMISEAVVSMTLGQALKLMSIFKINNDGDKGTRTVATAIATAAEEAGVSNTGEETGGGKEGAGGDSGGGSGGSASASAGASAGGGDSGGESGGSAGGAAGDGGSRSGKEGAPAAGGGGLSDKLAKLRDELAQELGYIAKDDKGVMSWTSNGKRVKPAMEKILTSLEAKKKLTEALRRGLIRVEITDHQGLRRLL